MLNLKGHWHEKGVSNNALGLQYEPQLYLKHFLSSVSKLRFVIASFYLCTCGPGPQIKLKPGAWLNFLILYPVCPRPILMVCGLPPGYCNLTSGCHGDSKTANFSPRVCSPTGEAGRNVQTGFFLWSAVWHRLFPDICGLPPSSIVGGKGYKFFDAVSLNFSKIVAFRGTIRKI
jgi:hypothetical protein